ncbi:biopolymer transporter ExbD [Candidatus Vallotiella sp. (ex Adelges kitamiensis)]|uniref:biopolymer transporter ExbD n=1 Tax=Candidatus Vallotiella sp. (ex Adelges kitamiensis) TaxID=2864217 RepID=UPI001CE2F870|nr:biopolymer transporter ExbD [Candidatus Vallotia sp. (ex Adelges kitamiensis)]
MAGALIGSNLRGSRSRRAMSDINVVSYIDVLFVLLVIFMVTTPILSPSIIKLPSVSNTVSEQQKPPVIVNIKSDSTISVKYNDDTSNSMQELPITLSDLNYFIAKRMLVYPGQTVVIGADKSLKYEIVMNLVSELKVNGVKHIGLFVNPI